MKIKDILYCPLDLPPVPADITSKNFDAFEVFYPKEPTAHLSLRTWKIIKLRVPVDGKDPLWSEQHQGDWDWTHDAKIKSPNLIKWIETHLPFKKIKFCAVISSRGVVDLHNDTHPRLRHLYENEEPCLYRFCIQGPLIQNGFYLSVEGIKIYTEQPIDSPGWVMNATDCDHGNDDATPYNKILGYAMGTLDRAKHEALVKKSYDRYKNFAIIKKNPVA